MASEGAEGPSRAALKRSRESIKQRLAYLNFTIPIFEGFVPGTERSKEVSKAEFDLVWSATNDMWKSTDEAKEYKREYDTLMRRKDMGIRRVEAILARSTAIKERLEKELQEVTAQLQKKS